MNQNIPAIVLAVFHL